MTYIPSNNKKKRKKLEKVFLAMKLQDDERQGEEPFWGHQQDEPVQELENIAFIEDMN